ncbi:SPFH domain-containing protein [Lichenifustis flavocetrariae]|uniref:SPFH domain-containing protein n=1 Tax=Lichenifustis flavocetrariae TaxID=2949735 RepID=A0AA41Z3H6_9HYPH|nr:SPFH domain-containing protein [Lichenifustis flavocetrariae]MCW6512223.1 SPFH domain-containing protein [Lichenifustis flavocetrariae]
MNVIPSNEQQPWGAPQQGKPKLTLPPVPMGGVAVLVAVGALIAASFGSFYTVQPTEMAGVRRLGTIVTAEPVGPGLHYKVPFIDTVDTIQTSLDTFQLSNLTVYTVDNQAVNVGVGLSYKIPAAAVLKLLYSVGRSGNVDISENIRPVLADRVLRVFSTQNTVSISANREQIAGEIRKGVSEALGGIFGIELVDLQLSSIAYSPSFQASVEAAVQAKNDAIRAENTVVKVRYEGEQQKVQADAQAAVRIAQANGEAQATIAQARSQREASILRAEGDAQAASLVGEAQARVIQQVGAAVNGNAVVVSYETAHRWNGQMPSTVLGSSTSPLAMLNLPPAQK